MNNCTNNSAVQPNSHAHFAHIQCTSRHAVRLITMTYHYSLCHGDDGGRDNDDEDVEDYAFFYNNYAYYYIARG